MPNNVAWDFHKKKDNLLVWEGNRFLVTTMGQQQIVVVADRLLDSQESLSELLDPNVCEIGAEEVYLAQVNLLSGDFVILYRTDGRDEKFSIAGGDSARGAAFHDKMQAFWGSRWLVETGKESRFKGLLVGLRPIVPLVVVTSAWLFRGPFPHGPDWVDACFVILMGFFIALAWVLSPSLVADIVRRFRNPGVVVTMRRPGGE